LTGCGQASPGRAPGRAASGSELPRQGGEGDVRSRAGRRRSTHPGRERCRIPRFPKRWGLETTGPTPTHPTRIASGTRYAWRRTLGVRPEGVTMATQIDRNGVQEMLGAGAQLVEVLPGKEYAAEHLPGANQHPTEAPRPRDRAAARFRAARDRLLPRLPVRHERPSRVAARNARVPAGISLSAGQGGLVRRGAASGGPRGSHAARRRDRPAGRSDVPDRRASWRRARPLARGRLGRVHRRGDKGFGDLLNGPRCFS
jgi:hypothetical protein